MVYVIYCSTYGYSLSFFFMGLRPYVAKRHATTPAVIADFAIWIVARSFWIDRVLCAHSPTYERRHQHDEQSKTE